MRRIALLALIAIISCQHRHAEDPAYLKEIQDWQAKRAERLKSPDGWLSLVGLQWLNPGANVLEGVGKFDLNDGKVTYTPAAGGSPQVLRDDTDPNGPTVIQLGTKRITAIKRSDKSGDKYGLRVKDENSPARVHFLGLEYFPINSKWRFKAHFEPYNPPHKVPIVNVLGMTSDETSPGELAFEVDGQTYKIQPILEQGESDWFVIFKDATSGHETYAAARYLYVHPPGPDGTTILDFNKAYNPPCTFTPYATCPLPPPQNKLPLRVEAGELKYRGHA
ncbi:MAG TPA: DUF1684 domain-containing protein [Thermoanaerobaculia bacterium]|nr:DUF1684 domain-containing protein [Thermoanaerobaculia bacterium]